MKKMISILTVLVLSIVTMLPVKVMAAEYPHKNSEVKHVNLLSDKTEYGIQPQTDGYYYREKRGLIQEILAAELGITQQMLSKYERDVTLIKVDILKKIATYFNVTTDYLLGVSDVKRDLQRQMKMNETLDEYYDLIEIYKDLDSYDKEMIWSIMQTVKKVGEKRKKDNKLIEES